jgi:hypothetical protein
MPSLALSASPRNFKLTHYLVETLGGNANGVLDAFGVGEGDDAGADVWHRFIIGEGKTKNERG